LFVVFILTTTTIFYHHCRHHYFFLPPQNEESLAKKSESTPVRPEEAAHIGVDIAAATALAALSMEKEQQLQEEERKKKKAEKAAAKARSVTPPPPKRGHHQGDTWQFSFRHPLTTTDSSNSLYDVDFSPRIGNDTNNNGNGNGSGTDSNNKPLLTLSQEKILAAEQLSWAELRIAARKKVALRYADHILHKAVIKVTPAFARQRRIEEGLKRAQSHKVSVVSL
jgi:hypothetical protein